MRVRVIPGLEPIIKRVEEDVHPDPSCQALVVVETRLGRALTMRRRYLITNANDPAAVADRVAAVTVGDPERGRALDLLVDYRVSCEPGRERAVAEALHAVEPPREVLDKRVRAWILEYAEGREGSLAQRYGDHRPRLEAALAQRAREIGLVLTPQLRLETEGYGRPSSLLHIPAAPPVRDAPARQEEEAEERPMVLDADLDALVHRLCGGPRAMEIDVAPRGGDLPLTFEGSFSVSGVRADAWQRFASCRPELDDVARELAGLLRARLSERTSLELLAANADAMLAMVQSWVPPFMTAVYGLAVTVTRWRRRYSGEEEGRAAIKTAAVEAGVKEALETLALRRDMRVQDLAALYACRGALTRDLGKLLRDGAPEEIRRLEERLASLDARIAGAEQSVRDELSWLAPDLTGASTQPADAPDGSSEG